MTSLNACSKAERPRGILAQAVLVNAQATREAPMAGPFIFVATNRLKPGKLEDEHERVRALSGFIDANEPRLLAFNEYANEEGTEVGVVQVHPDADSMYFHMNVIREQAARAYR